MNKKILFLGGGNMTRAIVMGLLVNGYDPKLIYIVDRNEEKRVFFSTQLKTHVSQNNDDFLALADIIVLAIKPQNAKEFCLALKQKLAPQNPLIISVMTGITLEKLNDWMGAHLSIVRAMPNTPSMVQAGATGLFANANTTPEQKIQAETMLNAVGITAWLAKEKDINTIAVLSGSGPAYYFYMVELMRNIAIDMGLPEEIAQNFAKQTIYGAAKLALESEEDVTVLRAQVTSKKGATEAAIQALQAGGLDTLLEKAMQAARNRSLALNEEAS